MSESKLPNNIENAQNQIVAMEDRLSHLESELQIAQRRIGLASHIILALLTSQNMQTGIWEKEQFDGADPAKPFDSIQNALSLVAKALCIK